MNNRIKELIAEADRKCSETRGIYDEILAELIVQACAKVCADNGMRAGGGNTIVGETFLDASKLIRGNFGLDTFGLY